MNYTLDRFPQRSDKPLMEAVKDTLVLSVGASTLEKLINKEMKRKQDSAGAKRSMLKMMHLASRVQPEEEEEDHSLWGKALWKVLKFVGKRFIKAVVRPILSFAGRMAMSVIRIVATTILRFVIVPIIQAVVTFVVANPITAGILAVGSLLAGGYYLWKRFFGEPAAKPLALKPGAIEVEPVEEVDTTNVAEADTDIAGAAQAQVAGSETVQQEVQSQTLVESAIQVVSKPVDAVTQFVKGKKKGKFTGFGSDVDAYIKETVQRYPILPEPELRGFIKMEAGWTGAMSPTGAIGTGQFIQSTWDSLAATKEGQAIGMTKIGKRFRKADDPRFDKRINTLATGLLASQNATMLQKNGLPITGENLYMMHNIGPGIIPVMLGQPASAKTLLAMKQNGMTAKMSAADFLAFQKGRFNVAFQEANSATAIVADTPQMAKAITVDKPVKVAQAQPVPEKKAVGNNAPQKTDLIRGPGSTIVRA